MVTLTLEIAGADASATADELCTANTSPNLEVRVRLLRAGPAGGAGIAIGDARKHLGQIGEVPMVLTLLVPASYVVKKILDPVLKEIGTYVAGTLTRWAKRIAHRNGADANGRKIQVVVRLEEYRYVLAVPIDERPTADDLSEVLRATTSHFLVTTEGSSSRTYSLSLNSNQVDIRVFDPFESA